MSLQIIGAGYGRTGTLSLKHALEELGYPCYHMEEVLNTKQNKDHLNFWLDVAESERGSQHNWSEVFENYSATVDNPGCCVYQELLDSYTDAKVILSLHPKGPEAWYESTMSTIYFFGSAWEGSVLSFLIPFFRRFNRMAQLLIWDRSHQGTMNDKSAALERYTSHIEEVKARVPKHQLLIFTVDQGWEPLCTFLQKDIPDQAFPRVNDKESFQKRIRMFKGLTYFILFVGFSFMGTILWLLFG